MLVVMSVAGNAKEHAITAGFLHAIRQTLWGQVSVFAAYARRTATNHDPVTTIGQQGLHKETFCQHAISG